MNVKSIQSRRAAGKPLALAVLLALAGCAGDVVSDDEMVRDEVVALGYDRDAIELDGNVIRVEGDIILYRDKLLNGEYAPAVRVHDHDELIQKGYRHTNLIGAGANNLKLIWGTGSQLPTLNIRNAFISAAGDYNSIAGSSLRISQNNTGATIRVRMMDPGLWPTGTPCSRLAPACAQAPTSSGGPGANVYIKASGVNPQCVPWNASTLAHVARHELAHTLGIMHPDGNWHIIGTQQCSAVSTNCADNPGYSTIMKATMITQLPGCTTSPTVLQTDDRASINALY